MTGGGTPPVTATLSNVDVFRRVVSWLVTASPMYAAAGAEKVVTPTCVHALPFDDTGPVPGGAGAGQFQPPGRHLCAAGEPVGRAAARGADHEFNRTVRAHVENHVRRASRERRAKHDAGFGVCVGVLDAGDARDDLNV